MTLTKRRKRTARKLILPLIAVGMMATMMFMEAAQRSPQSSSQSSVTSPRPSAARVNVDMQRR